MVLEKENAGYFIDASIKSIDESLIKIISLEKKEYQLMQENCINLVKDNFSYNKNIHLWRKFYNDVF